MRPEAAIGPTSDGSPLELSVECRTSRSASRGRLHPITIHVDWTVETPHDLDAERIGAAFGGYTSCLELVDQVIPVVARIMPLLARRTTPPLRRGDDGQTWIVPSLRGCRCSHPRFKSAQAAAAHLRSPAHLSRQHKVAARPLRAVLEAVAEASDLLDLRSQPGADAASGALVLEPAGVRELWAAGIHPSEIAGLAEHAPGVDGGLPVGYFLAVRYGDVDLDWLRRTVGRRPDPDVATWLARTPARHGLASDDVGDWLAIGLGKRQIEALVGELVRPSAAADLAAATDRTPHAAGVDLADWAAVGCHPGPEHFEILDRHGVGRARPPARAAIDRLVEVARHHRAEMSRTELGVLLALEGTQAGLLRALEEGVRSATDWSTGTRSVSPSTGGARP